MTQPSYASQSSPMQRATNRRILPIFISVLLVFLAMLTVFFHVQELRVDVLTQGGEQHERHLNVLEGTAVNPWAYRVLAEYLVAGYLDLFRLAGVSEPITIWVGFVSFRLLQTILVFFLAHHYFRTLGLNEHATLLGVACMAWGMTHAHWQSDLSFNTYFDVIFYLIAALLICYQRYIWIIPLIIVAAFNRETSGLIPFLLLFSALFANLDGITRTKAVRIWVVATLCYTVIFLGLRFFIDRDLETSRAIITGTKPGLDMMLSNLNEPNTWSHLFGTFTILPFLALWQLPHWPPLLKTFFWTLVPIWLVIHAFGSVIGEARLFLVPLVLVIIPGALWGLGRSDQADVFDPA